MKIPVTYYFKFWLKNSLLALATGGIVGFLSGIILFIVHPYFNNASLGAGIFFLYFQHVTYKHFWGSKRGKFEYQFKESQLKQKSNSLLKQKISFPRYLFNHFHSSLVEDSCKELWENQKIKHDNEIYLLAIKMSEFARKDSDNTIKEIQFLKQALEKKPNDFLANFWLAIALEKTNSSEEANTHYELALSDPEISGSKLKIDIGNQINAKEPLLKTQKGGLKQFFK